jgi:hypothetical protein
MFPIGIGYEKTLPFLHHHAWAFGSFKGLQEKRTLTLSIDRLQNYWSMALSTHILDLPWIPEPSVNNKLKRREGSGSTGRFFD